jgi:acyl dehydratase
MNTHARRPALYLEDFPLGSVYMTPEVTVTREQLVDFARQYDPQPYHLDDEAGRRSVFGGISAGGFQIAAFAWKLGLETRMFDDCAMAGIGIDELRWLRPLKPGDTIKCRMTVVETRPSRSKPDRGGITFAYEMINQHGETIMTLKLIQMLRRRPVSGDVAHG